MPNAATRIPCEAPLLSASNMDGPGTIITALTATMYRKSVETSIEQTLHFGTILHSAVKIGKPLDALSY
ncbi:hypothetical protein [Pseudomonas fluorescens]|uniref:hypothetical protein n=1 Tax=Pseudomonas fluorescens TaxID=294 RepID=UPI00223C41FD|nr:hypothetical protein [Pseudomonas fluorescens]